MIKEKNDNDSNIINDKITQIDEDNNKITNGLTYYDAQEVAISLASIRMFYKQRDFGSMFKPSIDLSQMQESPRLDLSPEKRSDNDKMNTKTKPTEPAQGKSSKSASPRKTATKDKINQKVNVTPRKINDKLDKKLNGTILYIFLYQYHYYHY